MVRAKKGVNIVHLLKRSKFGYTSKDKLLLFISISISIAIYLTLRIFLRIIYRKKERDQIFEKKNYTLLSWISNRPTWISRDEVILSIYPRNELYYLDPDYEKTERNHMCELNLSEGTIMDIGANIGLYAIMLAKRYPNLKLIAIEASPTIFNRLKMHCVVNNVSNVILLNKAISNKENEIIELYMNTNTIGSSTILSEYKQHVIDAFRVQFHVEKVETVTIDTLNRVMNVDSISLLKMDIEGAENLALDGAKTALECKKIKNMVIEYHSLQNYQYITSLLDSLEYIYSTYEKTNIGDPKILGNFTGHIVATLSHANCDKA